LVTIKNVKKKSKASENLAHATGFYLFLLCAHTVFFIFLKFAQNGRFSSLYNVHLSEMAS